MQSSLRELRVETRRSDTMAGGSGAAGPAPDVRLVLASGYLRDIPIFYCKKNVGIGISLDQPGIF